MIQNMQQTGLKKKTKELYSEWKSSYFFRTAFSAAMSAGICIAFAVFSGILGIVHASIWNGTICVYYLLLVGIRISVVRAQKKQYESTSEEEKSERRVYFVSHIVLAVMDLSLIAPIIVMVIGKRKYDFGLIPAIAMAAYTTYRVAMSIYHYRKAKKDESLLVAELRTIDMIDTIVSVLGLQNTLILAVMHETNKTMTIMTACTSTAFFLLIVYLTVRSFLHGKEHLRG